MLRTLAALSALLGVVVAGPGIGGCPICQPTTQRAAYNNADFVGDVRLTSVRSQDGYNFYTAEPQQVFKPQGFIRRNITIQQSTDITCGGPLLFVNGEYLVAAKRNGTNFQVTTCSGIPLVDNTAPIGSLLWQGVSMNPTWINALKSGFMQSSTPTLGNMPTLGGSQQQQNGGAGSSSSLNTPSGSISSSSNTNSNGGSSATFNSPSGTSSFNTNPNGGASSSFNSQNGGASSSFNSPSGSSSFNTNPNGGASSSFNSQNGGASFNSNPNGGASSSFNSNPNGGASSSFNSPTGSSSISTNPNDGFSSSSINAQGPLGQTHAHTSVGQGGSSATFNGPLGDQTVSLGQ